MKDAESIPNVVKVCNKLGLFDELEDLQKRQAMQLKSYRCLFGIVEYLHVYRVRLVGCIHTVVLKQHVMCTTIEHHGIKSCVCNSSFLLFWRDC